MMPMPRTIRILHFSPSTATGRHDSHRACLGIVHFVQEAIGELHLAHRVELLWALPAISSKEQVQALLNGGGAHLDGTTLHAKLVHVGHRSAGVANVVEQENVASLEIGFGPFDLHTFGETAVHVCHVAAAPAEGGFDGDGNGLQQI